MKSEWNLRYVTSTAAGEARAMAGLTDLSGHVDVHARRTARYAQVRIHHCSVDAGQAETAVQTHSAVGGTLPASVVAAVDVIGVGAARQAGVIGDIAHLRNNTEPDARRPREVGSWLACQTVVRSGAHAC